MSQEPIQLPPKAPAPDISDYTMETIREGAPVKKVQPRRAQHQRSEIWTYLALGGYFAIAGFIGAFLGTLAANIL